MAANGLNIADGRAIMNFLPERLPVNKQIVEIMILSKIENVKPEQKPINDSVADGSQVSPAIGNTNVIGGFVMVPEDKEFKFKSLCPYCKGDLTYTCNGWEQDDNGFWVADSFDMNCSTEPDMEDEDDWNGWFNNHSEMPYVHQMPVDEAVKKYINSKYRFELKH